MDDIAVVILAAGKGTRMKSDLAKVLHPVAGKSMVNHVVACAEQITRDHIHLVVGHQADKVEAEVSRAHKAHFALQERLLGTGDAVKAALPMLDDSVRHVLVLYGDVPLIRSDTLKNLVDAHRKAGSALTV
ncbi:MAG TPA: nucleoside-diphosphate-sugar pyrophosphorylase, partial [Desulfobacteraceae bacterium]|nr:nucleoside-diphosphate-sugar pyrophosphorylase [Desulfobacteraceae bacterium]